MAQKIKTQSRGRLVAGSGQEQDPAFMYKLVLDAHVKGPCTRAMFLSDARTACLMQSTRTLAQLALTSPPDRGQQLLVSASLDAEEIIVYAAMSKREG